MSKVKIKQCLSQKGQNCLFRLYKINGFFLVKKNHLLKRLYTKLVKRQNLCKPN